MIALFAGLGLQVYKVDLSLVVSKWVGETEKNLGGIVDAAAVGDLVLFFDEADALFGKRSEVNDARDRYASIEVAYLLQRLETYGGPVVLATNLQRNMDQAFPRRISVSLDFTLPEEDQRLAIWTRAFPPSAPTRGINLAADGDGVAGVERVGAEAITMEHVVLAHQREFQKLGRMCTEAEFGEYHALVAAPA